MRKLPFLLAGTIVVLASQAPMALTSTPKRDPNAKVVQVPPDQRCKFLPFEFDLARKPVIKVQAPKGKICADQFKPQGIVLQKFEVAKQPKNGTVNLNQTEQRWYYRSRGQFKGKDFFTLRLEGYDSRKWGATIMTVEIQVD